jgi:hypothetical protein
VVRYGLNYEEDGGTTMGGGIAGKMVGVWKEEKIYKLFGCIKR